MTNNSLNVQVGELLTADDWAIPFFNAYTGQVPSVKLGNLSQSLKNAKVSRDVYRNRMENDAVFSTLKIQADEEINDAIRSVIYDHAINGTEKPVHFKGNLVDTVTEYDHRLLTWLAERRMPEEFHMPARFELVGADTARAFTFMLGETSDSPAPGEVVELGPGEVVDQDEGSPDF